MSRRKLFAALIAIVSMKFFISAVCPWTAYQANLFSDYHFTGRWIELTNGFYTNFYDNDFYIPVKIHNNILTTHPNFPYAVENAANHWNNITNSYFNIEIMKNISGAYDYSYISTPIVSSSDLTNLIGFDQGNEFFDPNYDDSKKYLAITHVHIPQDEFADPPDNTIYSCAFWYSPRIVQADVNINPHVDWELIPAGTTNSGYFDFTTNATHEFGHLAGLKHIDNHKDAIMYFEIKKSKGQKSLQTADYNAIQALYGGCDDGQVSFIPCSKFEPGLQFVIAAEDPGDEGCFTCDCEECRVAGLDSANISDRAYQNMILYGTQNCHYTVNKLRKQIVENQEILATIATSESSQYANAQVAMRNCRDICAGLLDATFRCELNVISADLTLEDEHIEAALAVINAFLELEISQELKDELIKLRTNLPSYEGLNIKEAAVLYDNSDFQ